MQSVNPKIFVVVLREDTGYVVKFKMKAGKSKEGLKQAGIFLDSSGQIVASSKQSENVKQMQQK